ncbi:MAG: phenylalanine--tRNA ligase subunit beta [Spirochaetaceae bacterium]|jgi:phenylalanyl-tRNA synthetase beta chain|nr:phenylalanine--tRNA ligase subunit beta [Spirochaetaceae bacterium]
MPKIEVNEELFYTLAQRRFDTPEAFQEALSVAKAELDEDSDKTLPPHERTLKIELNDTNRPDLWSTAGCARQLRVYAGGEIPRYPFFSSPTSARTAGRTARVAGAVQKVRPFLAGFIASGAAITDAALRDMIQTQEKLAWNFGRKRRTVSMGLYRTARVVWPVVYTAVDPDSVSFVPLQWDAPLTLREILRQHPKGREYAFIQEHEPLHPLLLDSSGQILSYPPIINSADLGAVQVGDRDIFVEVTGTDMPQVLLAASIMACDLADQGYTIEPVAIEYEYNTPFGRRCVTPFYFQEPVFCAFERIERILGKNQEELDGRACKAALRNMGVPAEEVRGRERGQPLEKEKPGMRVYPPPYRNDFLHAADAAEDVMIGQGLCSFTPRRPRDFTVGRLSPITAFSRTVREILTGMGYQEMIYNYLGSRKDLVDTMRGDGKRIIRVANPMTENYEYVRDSVLASLCMSEAVSGHAAYPHKICEIGKVAYRDPRENDGTSTRTYAGFLAADKDATFNTAAAQVQTLFYYLSREYAVEEAEDPRFIPGRVAAIRVSGSPVGVFGEIHPEVLAGLGAAVPCIAGEIDLDALL